MRLKNNHKQIKFIVIGLLLLSLGGCKKRKNGIALVGLDQNGQAIDFFVSPRQYSGNLNKLLNSVSESAMPALEDVEKAQIWELRTVLVGLGFNLEAGVGPLIKVGGQQKMRLVFSNSKKPSIP